MKAPQRLTDAATNSVPTKPKRKPAELQVPIPVWKNGMYCIDMPELTPPGGLMTKIWAKTEAEAQRERSKALAAAKRLGSPSVGIGQMTYCKRLKRQWSSSGVVA